MLKRRTWLTIAAPTKLPGVVPFTCGQTSRQLPQEIHVESLYAFSCVSGATRGPSPRSYVPSIGIHALTRFKLSNMNCRSTARSRTTGNFDIGSSRIGCSNLSTNAEQALRAYLSLNFYDDLSFSHKSLANRLLRYFARLKRAQHDSFFRSRARSDQAHRHLTASYLRGRGVICEMST